MIEKILTLAIWAGGGVAVAVASVEATDPRVRSRTRRFEVVLLAVAWPILGPIVVPSQLRDRNARTEWRKLAPGIQSVIVHELGVPYTSWSSLPRRHRRRLAAEADQFFWAVAPA